MLNKMKLFFVSSFIVILITFLIIPNMGNWLVRDDKPQKANAIIILMGSIPDRVLHAAELYKKGYAPRLLIVEENMTGFLSLKKRGVDILSNSQQCSNAAQQLGVPSESIVIINGMAQSTIMEAQAVRDYLLHNTQIDSLIIVSSSAHMRRAGIIFKKVFKKAGLNTVVTTSPSPYSSFDANRWWTNREDIQQVLSEYIKLTVFIIYEQWKD